MFNEVENSIFYPSNNKLNRNIGFSSSNGKKKALSFTPNDIHINRTNTDFFQKSKSVEKEMISVSDNDSDSSNNLLEEIEEEETECEENKNFKRNQNKHQSLALFSENYDILCNKIIGSIKNNVKKRENLKRNNSIDCSKLMNNLESITSNINNTENINDFYEYTEICFEHISQLGTKPKIKESQYVKLNISNKDMNKRIALLDLDETLIHCVGEIKSDEINSKKCDKIITITLPSKKVIKVGINIRPNLIEALDIIKEKYNIVIFTASHSSYTDPILKEIDPENKYFKNRLYRNNCVPTKIEGKNFYVKDLDILTKYYNLKDMIIVDNSVLSFAYHLNNGIPIIPFYDSTNDNELIILAYYLSLISQDNDLRKSNQKHLKLELFLEEAKKIINGEEIKENLNDDEEIIITEKNTYIFMNENNHEKREQFIKLLNHYHNEFAKVAN